MKVLIIEDEIAAADILQLLICELCPDAEIVAVLQSIDESVEWIRNNPLPDLIFMDIHLADGSSFSIFDEVQISCPVIFTTAYDKYALKAFEVNSIDYLLKPINKKELERAIGKYKNLTSNYADNSELIRRLIENIKQPAKSKKTSFLVPQKDKLIPLSVSDIAYIYIDTKVVKAVTLNNTEYYIDETLDDLMNQLDCHDFCRVNRQFIISRKALKDLSVWFGGKLSINLIVPLPEKIIVSKAKTSEVKRWISEG